MIDYSAYFSFLETTPLRDITDELRDKVETFFKETSHGDLAGWLSIIDSLPKIVPSAVDLASGAVTVGRDTDCDESVKLDLEQKLMEFCPWRKGPFNLFGIDIDTEWRSDLKWARLASSIDLKDKLVLDVGCGNGYYMYRMLGAGAKAVVGVDPYMLFAMQFKAINKYIQTNSAAVLPLRFEDVPCGQGRFDSVFSMGLLYHRRDPQEHLAQLKSFLKPGGQLVLETIVLDKPGKDILVPEGRYAKMRNVWNIPTVDQLSEWISEAGFGDVKLVEMAKTTSIEQRKTKWMSFESLSDFLDPNDDNLTIEGYPAPVRAVITAVV
jgi:tRNA (mo5U34)-methyltransferase